MTYIISEDYGSGNQPSTSINYILIYKTIFLALFLPGPGIRELSR